jgi:DNA-binding XRE family transcriptional regulator
MALRGPLAQLKALHEAAGFTQEELATIAGLSVHAVSALERGERRQPHVETAVEPLAPGRAQEKRRDQENENREGENRGRVDPRESLHPLFGGPAAGLHLGDYLDDVSEGRLRSCLGAGRLEGAVAVDGPGVEGVAGLLSTGRLSPVMGASFTWLDPRRTRPSSGIRWPAGTRNVAPTGTAARGTSGLYSRASASPLSRTAVTPNSPL